MFHNNKKHLYFLGSQQKTFNLSEILISCLKMTYWAFCEKMKIELLWIQIGGFMGKHRCFPLRKKNTHFCVLTIIFENVKKKNIYVFLRKKKCSLKIKKDICTRFASTNFWNQAWSAFVGKPNPLKTFFFSFPVRSHFFL